MMGKTKNSVCFLFYEVGVWVFFSQTYCIRDFLSEWWYSDDFFRMFFPCFMFPYVAVVGAPFQNGRLWWGQILHSPILKADWMFFQRHESHTKKQQGPQAIFQGKKIPMKLLRFFFFLPWFIYIPLKKRQLGFKWPSYEKREAVSFRFPDFVDFSQGDRPSSHRNARREEGLAWEVPSS